MGFPPTKMEPPGRPHLPRGMVPESPFSGPYGKATFLERFRALVGRPWGPPHKKWSPRRQQPAAMRGSQEAPFLRQQPAMHGSQEAPFRRHWPVGTERYHLTTSLTLLLNDYNGL